MFDCKNSKELCGFLSREKTTSRLFQNVERPCCCLLTEDGRIWSWAVASWSLSHETGGACCPVSSSAHPGVGRLSIFTINLDIFPFFKSFVFCLSLSLSSFFPFFFKNNNNTSAKKRESSLERYLFIFIGMDVVVVVVVDDVVSSFHLSYVSS